jgi:hypothetical protein
MSETQLATETVCAKCGGTGWIIVEHANVSGAEACTCRPRVRTDAHGAEGELAAPRR